MFPEETGASQAPAPRQARPGWASLIPPQVRGAYDHAKDEVVDRANRMKGDIIGAGMDLATRFQPVDDVVSVFQRAMQRPHSPTLSKGDASNYVYITPDQLRAILPGAGRQADVFAPHINAAFRKYGISTPSQKAAFLAQVSKETGDLQNLRERVGPYPVWKMQKFWPTRFPTPESVLPYVGDARKLANYVYGGRHGNKIGTDDGYRYRGGGLIQVTGRDNYRSIGYEDNPEALSDPAVASEVSAKWWSDRGLNQRTQGPLDENGFVQASSKVNSNVGLRKERWPVYVRALKVLSKP